MKIKIAVAVDKDGNWSARGWGKHNGSSSEEDAMDICVDSDTIARYWVEAEIEIPVEVHIGGIVSKAEQN